MSFFPFFVSRINPSFLSVFHVHKKFADAFPDSALLIVMGLVLGFGLQQLKVNGEVFTLKSHVFFLYLLPPIIFDAGIFIGLKNNDNKFLYSRLFYA